MATTFSMFDTTPAGAVAAIKAAILTSTDWSNPAGDRVTCTTTRGAAMVVDLADAAATAVKLQLGVYRTTGLADKITRYILWRNSGGATTDPLHVTVSAGKEHLLITVEGPRSGEVNPVDATFGSYRPVFFLCDLVPYFSADTVPAVVCGGTTAATPPNGSESVLIHVSRNAANNASWVAGLLETLQADLRSGSSLYRLNGQSVSGSGMTARPWVVFEDAAGMRGRLAQFFNLGWNTAGSLADFPAQVFQRVTINSITYIGLTVNRATAASAITASPFALINGNEEGPAASLVVAVPWA
jgi:hypothetical protein